MLCVDCCGDACSCRYDVSAFSGDGNRPFGLRVDNPTSAGFPELHAVWQYSLQCNDDVYRGLFAGDALLPGS